MKVHIVCLDCHFKNQVFYSEMFEVADSGVYKMQCTNGHEVWATTQQFKFQVLFELGVRAIVDGYYREGVSSFIAALERFYEFYLEFQRERQGLSLDVFQSAWKPMSNISERQAGAFVFVYTFATGRSPLLLPNESTNLRNKVVHKGYIPKRTEAVAFGETVARIIQPVLNELVSSDQAVMNKMVGLHLNAKLVPPGARQATMSFPSFLDILNSPTPGPGQSLDEWVKAKATLDNAILGPSRTAMASVSTDTSDLVGKDPMRDVPEGD